MNVNICAMVKVVAFCWGMVIDPPPLMERNPYFMGIYKPRDGIGLMSRVDRPWHTWHMAVKESDCLRVVDTLN